MQLYTILVGNVQALIYTVLALEWDISILPMNEDICNIKVVKILRELHTSSKLQNYFCEIF